MIMTDERAKEIAETFIGSQVLRNDYEFIDCVRLPRFPNEVSVSFHAKDEDGQLFDGPVVVIVNTDTDEAKFFSAE